MRQEIPIKLQRKKLMDTLKTFVYEIFFKNFYGKRKKVCSSNPVWERIIYTQKEPTI